MLSGSHVRLPIQMIFEIHVYIIQYAILCLAWFTESLPDNNAASCDAQLNVQGQDGPCCPNAKWLCVPQGVAD